MDQLVRAITAGGGVKAVAVTARELTELGWRINVSALAQTRPGQELLHGTQ